VVRFAVSGDKNKWLEERMEALGIREKDIEETFIRSSGKGGQKVNKTSTCVRIRHLPTGIEVKWMTERSQSLNRFLARRELVKRVERLSGRPSAETAQTERIRRQKARRQRRSVHKYGETVPGPDRPEGFEAEPEGGGRPATVTAFDGEGRGDDRAREAVKTGNLYSGIPAAFSEEICEVLVETRHLRLERILSAGQATPAGEWFDQGSDEWVVLLDGKAGLLFEGESRVRVLSPGDTLLIPARCRHRVEWTNPAGKTVWLALHF
jgi:peptide chain release factor